MSYFIVFSILILALGIYLGFMIGDRHGFLRACDRFKDTIGEKP